MSAKQGNRELNKKIQFQMSLSDNVIVSPLFFFGQFFPGGFIRHYFFFVRLNLYEDVHTTFRLSLNTCSSQSTYSYKRIS